MTPKTNRLLLKNGEQLMFLKYNLRSTGYTSLPSTPSKFQAVNTLDRETLELDYHGLSYSDNDYEESYDSSASDVSNDESPLMFNIY